MSVCLFNGNVNRLDICAFITYIMLSKEELAVILDTDDFFNFDDQEGVYILFGSLRNKEKTYLDDIGIIYDYCEYDHYTYIDTTKYIHVGESLPY